MAQVDKSPCSRAAIFVVLFIWDKDWPPPVNAKRATEGGLTFAHLLIKQVLKIRAAPRTCFHKIAHPQTLIAMRPMLFAICVSASLFLENCRKDTPPPTTPPDPIDTTEVPIDTPPISHVIDFGKHFVSKNNVPWTAKMKAYYSEHRNMITLIARATNSNGFEESIDIRDLPTQIGKYAYEHSIGGAYNNFIPQVAFFYTLDGDQLVGAYSIDLTRPNNYIEVVRYDSINHIVEGRYQAILDNKSAPFPGVPDSMFLLNGKFHLKIDTI